MQHPSGLAESCKVPLAVWTLQLQDPARSASHACMEWGAQGRLLNVRPLATLPCAGDHTGLNRPCYFIDKAYHAQAAGADALLVVNDNPGDLSTAVAPKDEDSSR